MVESFKKELAKNGQSLKWFYDNFIKGNSDLSYSGFTGQLNGYAPINDFIKFEIQKYLNKK